MASPLYAQNALRRQIPQGLRPYAAFAATPDADRKVFVRIDFAQQNLGASAKPITCTHHPSASARGLWLLVYASSLCGCLA